MLLSSQAFSGFLNELSAKDIPAPSTAAEAPAPHTRSQPIRKDVNPHQVARQMQEQSSQIGLALVPEPTVDFSMLEVNPLNSWNSVNNFQVFAVTEISQGPAIDSGVLAGKKSNIIEPGNLREDTTKDLPHTENMPTIRDAEGTIKSATPLVNEDVELDPVAFALFFDSPRSSKTVEEDEQLAIFGNIPLEKVFHRIDLLVEDGDAETVAWARLEEMCFSLDNMCERISAFTSHIS